MTFIKPSRVVIDKYEQIVSPMLNSILNLSKKSMNLQQTRDLLLPKLISGEIDVENMDIDTGDIDDK